MTGGNTRGFSAVEMLITIAIFAVLSVSVVATYLNFTRLHRRVANAEVLGEEMRYVAELIVRSARSNTVDYPALPASIQSPSSTLSLVSSGDDPLWIRRFATSSSVCAGLNGACLAISTDSGTNWSSITGKNITVNRFDVYISPTQDPFDPVGIGIYANNDQPRVTFLIDANYVATNPLESAHLRLQTSVSSRLYLR